MVVEDDVTLVPTVETDRCTIYQDLEVTVKTWERFYSVNSGHVIPNQQIGRKTWIQQYILVHKTRCTNKVYLSNITFKKQHYSVIN